MTFTSIIQQTVAGEVYIGQGQVVGRPDVFDKRFCAAPHDDGFAEYKAAQLDRGYGHDDVVVAHQVFVVCNGKNEKAIGTRALGDADGKSMITFGVQLRVRVQTTVVDVRLQPSVRVRGTAFGEMRFQISEVQRRLARVARAVLDGRYDRTPRLRHRGAGSQRLLGQILSNGATEHESHSVFRPEP